MPNMSEDEFERYLDDDDLMLNGDETRIPTADSSTHADDMMLGVNPFLTLSNQLAVLRT